VPIDPFPPITPFITTAEPVNPKGDREVLDPEGAGVLIFPVESTNTGGFKPLELTNTGGFNPSALVPEAGELSDNIGGFKPL
jgi:hypothetical protein